MSFHHRPQQPLPSRSTRPSPSMQTRSSIARSTLSPDIPRSTRRSRPLDRTVSPEYFRQSPSRQLSTRPRHSRARGTNSSARIAAQSLIDLTESSPISHRSSDNSPPPSGQGDYGEHRYLKRKRTSPLPGQYIEEVDLTDSGETEEEVARRKAREDLLKTQQAAKKDEKRKVAGFTCVICMEDEPTDLAATPCGHMFCHLCLHGAIKASASPSNKLHGRCPVCRGKVSLKDVIPMEFKMMTKSQGKQKAV